MTFQTPTVYLAGPITDCTGPEANDWREAVALKLSSHGIRGVSPLRCEPIVGDRYGSTYADPMFGTARAISSKNVYDVGRCDMTLAYLPKPAQFRHQSYGTIAELAWAHAFRRPAVLVTDDPSVRDHPVLNACAGWLLTDLDQAVELIVGVLSGYTLDGKYV